MNMKYRKLLLGLLLFALGMIGVLSLLTAKISLDALPPLARARFTDDQLRWLILANPAVLVLIMVIVGTLLFDKAGLSVPTLSGLLERRPVGAVFVAQLNAGVIGGAVGGALMVGVSSLFSDALTVEMEKLSAAIQPSMAARFLYGGITEELLLRFGLMTLVLWLLLKLMPTRTTTAAWLSIAISTGLFALGHLPAVSNAVPDPSAPLFAYVMLGNSIGGLIFGWLYWKKGLEAAMIAHIMAHVVMVGGEALMPG
jgi:hypothetical protein